MNFYESKKWPKIFSAYFYNLSDKKAATWTEELFNGPEKISGLTDDEVCAACYALVRDRERPKVINVTHLRIKIFQARKSHAAERKIFPDNAVVKIGWGSWAHETTIGQLKKLIREALSDEDIWNIICRPNDNSICAELEGYTKSVHPDFTRPEHKPMNFSLNKKNTEADDMEAKKAKAKEQLKQIKEDDTNDKYKHINI